MMCIKCTLATYQVDFGKWTDWTYFLTTLIHLILIETLMNSADEIKHMLQDLSILPHL